LFEYFSQAGVMPIENNSTRNLSIVLMNNQLAFDRFIDLINSKIGSNSIEKPHSRDDFTINIQTAMKELAENVALLQIIGITLTTEHAEFIADDTLHKNGNITDIAIMCNGTLLIIEAKKNNCDATKQVQKQVNEFLENYHTNEQDIVQLDSISLTWDEIVGELDSVNELTNTSDNILNDYISHIRRRVPGFFPILPFSKIDKSETEHINKRLERFAENYYGSKDDVIYRNRYGEFKYWVKLKEKDYVKELCYQYDNYLSLHMYPGNTTGQGYHLFQSQNKLSILDCQEIEMSGVMLKTHVEAELKISDSWGRWKFNVKVNTKDPLVLKDIFTVFSGKETKDGFPALEADFDKYPNVLSFQEFKKSYYESFKQEGYCYTFLISLTLHIEVEIPYGVLSDIDNHSLSTSNEDPVVTYTKELVQKIYDRIEK